ncbi:MAG TPA: DUF2911 domain-containing protein [Bryobacteraceae bacterium]|jgi:hypothetical protein|nr:DUF2911 domain-containing protein [Bryobacteraceae bacterium]
MRRTLAFLVLAAATLPLALAQTDKNKYMTPSKANPPSNPQMATATINGKEIWLVYHAPNVKGRKIFGGEGALQANGTNWRGGADWATFLHTDAELNIGGTTVPAGEYTVFFALNQGSWDMILNKQTGQWGIKRDGTANFDPANNVAKVPMKMGKTPALVETLKDTLSSSGGNKGTLKLEWENTSASVDFTAK